MQARVLARPLARWLSRKIVHSIMLLLLTTTQTVTVFAEQKADKHPLEMAIAGLPQRASPPFAWIDQCDQQLTGSTTRLLEKIFSDMGYQIRWQYQPPMSRKAMPLLTEQSRQGEIDGIFATSKTDKYRLIYSDKPVIEIKLSVFVRRQSDYDSLSSLAEAKGMIFNEPGVATEALTLYPLVQQLGLKVDSRRSMKQIRQMILDGETDYYFGSKYSPEFYHPQLRRFDTDTVWSAFYFAMADTPEHRQVMQQFDQVHQRYYHGGYAEFLDRNYLRYWLNKQQQQPECTPESR